MQNVIETNQAPRHVQLSIYLLWGTLAVGIVMQFIVTEWSFSREMFKLVAVLAMAVVLHGYFIIGIVRGRSSARWVYLIIVILGLLVRPPDIGSLAVEPWSVGIEIARVCGQVLAFIWLFTQSANVWFKRPNGCLSTTTQ